MCRRMFPIVALRLSGLEPRELYELELEVVPADCRRYKFVNSTWVPVGAADSGILNPPYPHGDSPNTGEYWMSCRQIQFNKVKLTNSRDVDEFQLDIEDLLTELEFRVSNIVPPYIFG